jgi:hypothetical protein
VGVAGLLGGAAYLASSRERPVHVAQQIVSHAPPAEGAPAVPAEAATPVRFPNPFDASEVFEFPAGTSEADAHDAVAKLLLKRARDRLGAAAEGQRRHGKTLDPEVSVAAAGAWHNAGEP